MTTFVLIAIFLAAGAGTLAALWNFRYGDRRMSREAVGAAVGTGLVALCFGLAALWELASR